MYMGSVPLGQLMLTSDVENYPGFPDPVMGPELMDRMKGQAATAGREDGPGGHRQGELSRLSVRARRHRAGRTVRALSVIVATGATPRRLNLDSEMRLMGKGVSNCAVCDGFFFKGKKVAVVGGGDTAMEEATFLTNLASSVQVIHRGSELRACAALKEEAFADPKIKFTWNSVVTDVLGNGKVEGVAIKDVKTGQVSKLQVDGVFIAIGYEPNTKVFRGQLELESERLREGEERDGDQRPRGVRGRRRQGLQVPTGRHRRS